MFHELCTERVLATEYVDGMRFAAAIEQSQELRDAWGLAIVRFSFGNMYRHRVFNADPHPGNYLFHDDGTVTFLDFGCVKHFTPEKVAGLRRLGEAAWKGTDDEILDAFVGIGALKTLEGLDREYAVEWIKRGWEPVHSSNQPYRYTKEWAAKQVEDVIGMKIGKKERDFMHRADLPPDNVFLLRITAGIHSVLAALGATIDFRTVGPELWPA